MNEANVEKIDYPFALFPVRTCSGKLVWLKRVKRKWYWIGYAIDDLVGHSPYIIYYEEL